MWSHGETPCFDGGDVSGGERVQINDTVALLQHLFTAQGFDILAPAPGECLPACEGFCAATNCLHAR